MWTTRLHYCTLILYTSYKESIGAHFNEAVELAQTDVFQKLDTSTTLLVLLTLMVH